ncbi:MAG TPA: sugar porter family MFS transporter, partial [Bacteroidales bacterium]|nr:sugar porter family MFS transporter [Bacteroidales bacterium]
MKKTKFYSIYISLIIALGGFLMGFDASVISGVIKFVSIEFDLSPGQKGFAVASLTLTSTLAMMFAGPLSDKFGRKKVLIGAASLFFISAIYSALSPDFLNLIIARMIGGIGVGAALIVPPMYIAEIAPPQFRGRLVSFNQLNIVIGLSVAFFTNYLILQWGDSGSASAESLNVADNNWRYMLSLEAIPAVLYFIALFFVPESPRWLALRGKNEQAVNVLSRFEERAQAEKDLKSLISEDTGDNKLSRLPLKELFRPAIRYVLTIGVVIAILQQITGINAVFFYAPIIFEQTGIGTDASFANAVIIGLTNLVFTIVAIMFVDRLGRKPLLIFGLIGITISMFILSGSFKASTYSITDQDIIELKLHENYDEFAAIENMNGMQFDNDLTFKKELAEHIDSATIRKYESDILVSAIDINAWMVLFGIIAFVASFAVSLGPVMWILFSELFPDRLRGFAISFVGLINS